MEQQCLNVSKTFVRDLADGQSVDSYFVVRDRTRRQKKNGEAFLKLQLGDVTGVIEAVLWDRADELYEHCGPGGVVRVAGNFCVDQKYGASLTVRAPTSPRNSNGSTSVLRAPSAPTPRAPSW